MRQLIIQVSRGHGEAVVEATRALRGIHLYRHEASTPDDLVEVVSISVPNSGVDDLLRRLEDIPGLRITMDPRGVMALRAPLSDVSEQVSDVQPRSPSEVYLGGLQSVGSWTGFLGYAAAAGAVVWVGLFTNASYLLTAAMLIAPFAGPAMNAALATARGDPALLGRSVARYLAGLVLAIVEAGLLSLLLRQEVATASMVANSQVSSVALLLPLVAGAAGALNLVQSERNSLVSGAAVGMLVAASLAPPAGLIGMAGAIGRWDMAGSGAFLLVLQLAGINLSGSLVFRCFGVSTRGVLSNRGRRWVFPASLTASAMMLVGLVSWQFHDSPGLRRSSLAQRAKHEVERAVMGSELADLVEANVRFTRPDIPGTETLLSVVYARRKEGMSLPTREIRAELARSIRERIRRRFDVRPLVDVTVLGDAESGE